MTDIQIEKGLRWLRHEHKVDHNIETATIFAALQ